MVSTSDDGFKGYWKDLFIEKIKHDIPIILPAIRYSKRVYILCTWEVDKTQDIFFKYSKLIRIRIRITVKPNPFFFFFLFFHLEKNIKLLVVSAKKIAWKTGKNRVVVTMKYRFCICSILK